MNSEERIKGKNRRSLNTSPNSKSLLFKEIVSFEIHTRGLNTTSRFLILEYTGLIVGNRAEAMRDAVQIPRQAETPSWVKRNENDVRKPVSNIREIAKADGRVKTFSRWWSVDFCFGIFKCKRSCNGLGIAIWQLLSDWFMESGWFAVNLRSIGQLWILVDPARPDCYLSGTKSCKSKAHRGLAHCSVTSSQPTPDWGITSGNWG